tara:strand:+ start:373 stop:891 length:519 start_codon:yes stop_codon:yes gene_type:complete
MDVTQHSKDTMFTHTNSPFKNSNLCAGQQEVLGDLTQIVKKNFDLSEVQTALKPDTNETVSMTPAPRQMLITEFWKKFAPGYRPHWGAASEDEVQSMTPAPPPVQFSTELWDKFPTSESEYEEQVIKPKPKRKKYQCSFCGETGHNIQTCSLKAWKDEVDETIEQYTLAQLG